MAETRKLAVIVAMRGGQALWLAAEVPLAEDRGSVAELVEHVTHRVGMPRERRARRRTCAVSTRYCVSRPWGGSYDAQERRS